MSADRIPERVVVVGTGVGGLRTVETLRSAGFTGRISFVGDEPHPPYDRPPLSKQILAGQWPDDRAVLRGGDKLAELELDLHLGVAAVGAEPGVVELSDGSRLEYDALVIATGVRARKLPGQLDHPRMHVLRTLDDSIRLRTALEGSSSLLVVGAGFIGAEVASTAKSNGIDVTVIEALETPLDRVLGPEMGKLCGSLLEDNGIRLITGAMVERFVEKDEKIIAELIGGESIEADQVVVGVGSHLDLDWLAGLGLDTDAGLKCDERGLVVGTDNVYAVGDVAGWHQPREGDAPRIEHWTSACEQGTVVAQRIAGVDVAREADVVPYFWSDQFGLKIQLVGRPGLSDSVTVLHDPGTVKGTLAGYFRGDEMVAAVAFHSPKLVVKCRRLLEGGSAPRSEVEALIAELTSS